MEFAKLHQRMLAALIDAVIVLFGASLIISLISLLSEVLATFITPLMLLAIVLYFIILEFRTGQTLGKKIMNIMVVSADGKSITPKQSTIRNLLRIVDVLPFIYIVGIISIMLTKRKQRVGDILAKTIVVSLK